MKSIRHIVLFILFFAFNYNFAQTLYDVALVGLSFSPSDLTISVGDTVRWTNNGGFHNVQADDGSFSSGDASTNIWVYTHIFNTAGDFRYYCVVHGAPNGVGMAGIIHVEAVTGINDNVAITNFSLKQNYPNPFNPSTTIEYSIPKGEFVILKVYNVTGALEKTIVSGYKPGGNYTIDFDGSDLASGVYIYQLIAGNFISVKRMILLK